MPDLYQTGPPACARPDPKVALVGAGPGAVDLITLRALDRLQAAEVVLYDRLVNLELLDRAPQAECIKVGKGPEKKRFPQSQVNRLLIHYAQSGRRVVRLKGGDPGVFGLLGAEALALSHAQIPFEVVPGLSSTTALPSLCGVPLTHKGVSQGFSVISGHAIPGQAGALSLRDLSPDRSLVVVMGRRNLGAIAEQLMEGGWSRETPALLIQSGSTADQRTMSSSLQALGALAEGLQPPLLLVLGPAVAAREQWADSLVQVPAVGHFGSPAERAL